MLIPPVLVKKHRLPECTFVSTWRRVSMDGAQSLQITRPDYTQTVRTV